MCTPKYVGLLKFSFHTTNFKFWGPVFGTSGEIHTSALQKVLQTGILSEITPKSIKNAIKGRKSVVPNDEKGAKFRIFGCCKEVIHHTVLFRVPKCIEVQILLKKYDYSSFKKRITEKVAFWGFVLSKSVILSPEGYKNALGTKKDFGNSRKSSKNRGSIELHTEAKL